MKQNVKTTDLQEFTSIFSPVWDAHGQRLVFCTSKANIKRNTYDNQLCACDPTCGGVSVVRQEVSKRDVLALSDGTLLFPALLRGTDADYVKKGGYLTVFEELYPDGSGGEAFRLPLKDARLKRISDDLFIATAVCEMGRPPIEQMESEAKEAALEHWHESSNVITCTELHYCEDGRGFISGKRRNIFLFDKVTGNLIRLVGEAFEYSATAVYNDEICLVGIEGTDIRSLSQGMYIYHIPTGKIRMLIEPGAYHIKSIAYENGVIFAAMNPWHGFSSRSGHDLYRIDPITAAVEKLVDLSSEEYGFTVSGDCASSSGSDFMVVNGRIYYITTRKNTSSLCSWSQKEGVQLLTDDRFLAESFSIAGDRLIVCGCEYGALKELYLFNDGELMKLTDFHGAYLSSRNTSVPVPIQVQNRAGLPIDGWVIPPANFSPDRSYSGVLEIHGGPRMIYSAAFYHEMQVLSGMGYFVFFCNPRGSSGRGKEFANLRGKRGTIDYEDIMDFTEGVLAAYPQIDTKKLAVTGGSYGGFMTNWIIGHTNRFRVAVSCRSNSNIIGNYGVSDNGIWSVPASYGGDIWNDHALIWEQSPLKYAPTCVTPTLFIHSLEDYRCRVPNSMQMYVALKEHGTEAKMVLFKDESHSLSRSGKPQSRVRRLEELCGWIREHFDN